MMPPLSTHDLLELHTHIALSEAAIPAWLTDDLACWAVVRRGLVAEDRRVPVGFRGLTREHRFAAWIPADAAKRVIKPEDLVFAADHPSLHRLFSHLRVLRSLQPLLERFCWGPVGSVGFELATRIPVVGPASDLDLVIRMQETPSAGFAVQLAFAIRDLAPQADVLIEVPQGGIVLQEFARGGPFVLRTRHGPVLCESTAPFASADI